MREEILRKAVHLSSLWMLIPIYFFDKGLSVLLFTILFIFMIAFEFLRRTSNFKKSFLDRYLSPILREHEKTGTGLTGAFYVVLAVLLSLCLFSEEITFTAVAIMLLADTAAALIGRRWGTMNLFNKTPEGALAFFAVSFCIVTFSSICFLGLNIIEITLVSLVATLIEFFAKKIKVDDNLTITLGTALVLSLLV